ncbi:cyclase family protein [Rothia aerolata]|uniref:Cyclase n=1 Tax=Rothia aerolata TaxID=1812262 RepID=A0A917IWB5_9MICC|nr:cyclase family protein [Rothia aerolata]GGH65742.1 cyclase [Rothia aerolata]
MPNYPTYADLLQREGKLSGTSWGIFENPDRGTPSFITPQKVLEAKDLVLEGRIFNLDYPVDAFDPGMSVKREAPQHVIYGNHPAHRDDYLNGYYLQGSSQVDGLRHRRADGLGFYNGIKDDVVAPGTREIGVQHWAEEPLVTRCVLADLARFRDIDSRPIDHGAGEAIPLTDIVSALDFQKTELKPGDILIIRTGWAEWFLSMPTAQRRSQAQTRRSSGIEQSLEFLEWLWDHQVALVATDNFALECLPPVNYSPFKESAPNDRGMMHQELLAKLGMPIGELWKVDTLSSYMASIKRWEAMITVKPLNVVGATGSPANAMVLV